MPVYKPEGVMENILVNYRWAFVCFFLLPLSFLFEVWHYLRNWIVFKLATAPKQHPEKVKDIQRQIHKWIKTGRKKKMCTARPAWQAMSFRCGKYKNYMFNVIVNLVDILEICEENMTVRVEPMVTMGQLTATLNHMGLTIPVLPEIDDLTVGGLVMGTGIESSSHRYGLFQHTCVSYELVLGDGRILECSRDSNEELFYAIPWSYGTLGILTAVVIRLTRAKRFVRLMYNPARGLDNIVAAIEKATCDPRNEFVEGIMFNKEEAVIMTGSPADFPVRSQVNAIGKWYKPWFFIHVKEMLQRDTGKEGVPITEYIPLRDYYHRHTRSIFWELQDIIPFGNNGIFRYLLGWLVPPKVSFLKLTQTDAVKKLYENTHVIQDLLVPVTTMKTCIQAIHDNFTVYPLWLCPFLLPSNPGMVHPRSNESEMYVDIGVYGVPTAETFLTVESTRRLEQLVAECNGFQMLYADTYTTREEFRRMFDHTLYDKVRDELGSKNAFPEVYDKVSRDARV